jgi:hypothetical protein
MRSTPVPDASEEIGCAEECWNASAMCGPAAFVTGLEDMSRATACFEVALRHYDVVCPAQEEDAPDTPRCSHGPLVGAAMLYEAFDNSRAMLPYMNACSEQFELSMEFDAIPIPCRVLAAIGERQLDEMIDEAGGRKAMLLEHAALALNSASETMFRATGNQPQIVSAQRTNPQQAYFLVNNIRAGRPALPPGQSSHEMGLAVDVVNWRDAGPYLAAVGFTGGCDDAEDGPIHFDLMFEADEARVLGCRFVGGGLSTVLAREGEDSD